MRLSDLLTVHTRYPMPTKESRRRQIAARAPTAPAYPIDSGPAIRRLLYIYRGMQRLLPRVQYSRDRLRERVALLLGVERMDIERAERPLRGRPGWTFVQLPDTANDGRPVSPRDRLAFNVECPDVTALPPAPPRKRDNRPTYRRRAVVDGR